MKLKKKFHRQPDSCQPTGGPQLKTGQYVQAIEFYGNVKKTRTKSTSEEVQYLKSLIGLK